MKHRIPLFIFIFLFLGPVSCQFGTLPETGILRVLIRAEENSNPNADNQPAPVVLRIYQLSSDEIFQRERFMPLWQQDQALLKEQLLARKVTEPVYPGSRETLLLQLQPGTTHIGVLAGFSAAAQAKNKQIIAVLPLPVMQVSLFLDGQTLLLTTGENDEQ